MSDLVVQTRAAAVLMWTFTRHSAQRNTYLTGFCLFLSLVLTRTFYIILDLIHTQEEYAKLKRSPVMKAVDDQPVWSVICFVVPAEYRGQGVAQALLTEAVAYAKNQGATLVEAYPVDKPTRSNDDYMWFGARSMYDHVGFKEVARRKPHRPIVRIKPA